MKKRKGILSNILFFAFIIFLFSPYGLGVRTKLTEGITYLKGQFISPDFEEASNRINLDNSNVSLAGIYNASDVNLDNFKGKVVFLNHWATWCPPCRAEMPSMKKFYRDYKDKVAFVLITAEDENTVSNFYKKYKYDFPTYNLTSKIPTQLETTSIPATFILDKNGRVAMERFGPEDWNSTKFREKIDQLLAE